MTATTVTTAKNERAKAIRWILDRMADYGLTMERAGSGAVFRSAAPAITGLLPATPRGCCLDSSSESRLLLTPMKA
ncbi:hypothetical protein [Cupriavidus sp. L7L]|uniref:hypothetical protein n=1 Tax=Cupriavidus sp. L7L TaxID=2546443 RepID=UPI00352C46B7